MVFVVSFLRYFVKRDLIIFLTMSSHNHIIVKLLLVFTIIVYMGFVSQRSKIKVC